MMLRKSIDNLSQLVNENNIDAIQTLIDQLKKDRKIVYDNIDKYLDALSEAVTLGHLEIVDILINIGFYKSDCMWPHEKFEKTLIYLAVKNGHLPIVEYLLEREKSIIENVGSKQDRDYLNELIAASISELVHSNKHSEIVDYLLDNDNKGDTNHNFANRCPKISNTYLTIALDNGNVDMVSTLLHHSSLINYSLKMILKSNLDHEIQHIQNNIDEINKQTKLAVDDTNQKIEKLKNEINSLNQSYKNKIKMLFDNAINLDLYISDAVKLNEDLYFSEYKPLSIFKDFDVSGINFIGISINGQPITRTMLIECGAREADKAIITEEDLEKLDDQSRREDLKNKLNAAFQSQGKLLMDENIINLVPLWKAAETGDLTTVHARINAGVNPNERKGISYYPIALAARNNHEEIVQLLVDQPRLSQASIISAVNEAWTNGNAKLARMLISRIKDINTRDADGDTLLHKAVRNGDVARVKDLLCKGADPDIKNYNDETPLSLSILTNNSYTKESINHLQILDMFLNSIIHFKNHQSLLMDSIFKAIYRHNCFAIALLLNHIEKNDVEDFKVTNDKENVFVPWYTHFISETFDSAIKYSANNLNINTFLEILSLFKHHGVDFNKYLYHGETAFSGAHKSNDLSLLHYLLENGANPLISDVQGNTPLHYAVREDYTDIPYLSHLLQKGANINAQNKKGETPLHVAVFEGRVEIIKWLIENNANINVINNDRLTPLQLFEKLHSIQNVNQDNYITIKRYLLSVDSTNLNQDMQSKKDLSINEIAADYKNYDAIKIADQVYDRLKIILDMEPLTYPNKLNKQINDELLKLSQTIKTIETTSSDSQATKELTEHLNFTHQEMSNVNPTDFLEQRLAHIKEINWLATRLSDHDVSPVKLDEIHQSSLRLDEHSHERRFMTPKLKSVICGFIGAAIGFVVGASIGALATSWGGGFGAFAGALIGGVKGFTVGTAIALGVSGLGSISGLTFGFFHHAEQTLNKKSSILQNEIPVNRGQERIGRKHS